MAVSCSRSSVDLQADLEQKCDTYSRRLGRNNDAFSNADRDASSQGKGPLADTFEREFDSSISTRD